MNHNIVGNDGHNKENDEEDNDNDDDNKSEDGNAEKLMMTTIEKIVIGYDKA